MNSPQSLLVISFPDRRGKKETVYLGMFKAKILVLGPCEVFCFHSATNVSVLRCEGTFQSYVVVFFKERIRV